MSQARKEGLDNDMGLRFASFCGEMAESLSFNRSVGQIYGLLYIEDTPLSLSEIARRLSMSKGNASINLRALEAWGAVQKSALPGSRQDHYEANRDVKALAMKRIKDGLAKRMDMAEKHLNRWEEALSGGKTEEVQRVRGKMKDLKALVSKGRMAIQVLPKLAGFL